MFFNGAPASQGFLDPRVCARSGLGVGSGLRFPEWCVSLEQGAFGACNVFGAWSVLGACTTSKSAFILCRLHHRGPCPFCVFTHITCVHRHMTCGAVQKHTDTKRQKVRNK